MARISIDTTVRHSQNEAYGFTGLDLSLQGATAGNSARIAFLAALRGRLGSCYGGAVDKYKHEVETGDSQYNMIPSEITALGQNPATLQDGVALTSPGFGFTNDLLSSMYQMGVRKMVYVANIVPPLIPYIGGAINYAALDYTDVANEFIIFRNKCAAYGITVPYVQGCLETNIGNFTDVFSEGGVTYGKVMDKLITKLKDIDPAIKVYLDAYNYYDTSNPWATWTEDTIDNISAPNLAYVFGIRNYLNFDDSYNTLADALAYGDTLPDMVDYVRSFNSEWHINFQQLTVRNSNDLRGTCAQGIVSVNAFLNALQLQIDENNPFDIINFQSINSVSNQYPETINPVYEYLKRFGRLAAGELIEVDLSDFPNCKGIASLDGNTLTLGILNYGDEEYNYEGIDINGIANSNGVIDAVYSALSTSEDPEFSTESGLLKTFSMTEIVFDLLESGTDTLRFFRGTDESDINSQIETFLSEELNGNGIVNNYTISYERSLILVGLEISWGIPNVDTKIKVFVDSVTSRLQERANTYYQENILLGYNSNSIINDKYVNYSKTAIGNSNESVIICIANPAGYLAINDPGGGSVTNLAQTLFVSKLGNDSTAIRGNIGKPFLTLDAAIAASLSGDNIIVYSGSYTVSANLAKVGVSWFFNDCNVTHSATAFDLDENSFTGLLSVKGKVNFTCVDSFILQTVLGNTEIDIDVSDVTTSEHSIFILSSGTNFNIKFKNISSQQRSISIQAETEGATVNVNGNKCTSVGTYALFIAANGNNVYHNFNIQSISTTNETAVHFINCGFRSSFMFGRISTSSNARSMVSANCNGNLSIRVGLATTPVTFQNAAAGGLYLDLQGNFDMVYGSAADDCIFNCILNFRGVINTKIRINGGYNNIILEGGKVLNTTSDILPDFNHNDGFTILRYVGADLSALNTAGNVFGSCHRLNVSGGILKVTGYMFEACDGNVRTAHTVSNGELILENLLLYTQGGTPGVGSSWTLIALTGGKLNINNSSFRNRFNGSATLSYVIDKSGGTMILKGAVMVTDAGSSDSIHASGAQTIKIYGNSFTNRATGGGVITYQVGTVANLIVDANVTI